MWQLSGGGASIESFEKQLMTRDELHIKYRPRPAEEWLLDRGFHLDRGLHLDRGVSPGLWSFPWSRRFFTRPARCSDVGRVHSRASCNPQFYRRKSHRSHGRVITARREVSMWQTCYAVFVVQTTVFAALVALDAWVYQEWPPVIWKVRRPHARRMSR